MASTARVFQLRASNQPLFLLRNGLINKDIAKIELNGPQLEKQVSDFRQEFPSLDSVAASFLQEAQEVLNRYKQELPELKKEDQIRKEILRLKTLGHEFKLQSALAQKDAAGVIQYGKCFREDLKSFAEKFGQEELGKQYLSDMAQLLQKLNNEEDSIIRTHKVKEAVVQLRGAGDMMKLNMALNMKDAKKIAEHGEAFKAQFADFMNEFGNQSSARPFISEAQGLLGRYAAESPSIFNQDKMKNAIADFRTDSDMMAMQSAVHAQDLEYVRKHGPSFETKLYQFLARYNTNSIYAQYIPAHFMDQARDIIERYYKLMNIPKAFNPKPSSPSSPSIIQQASSHTLSPHLTMKCQLPESTSGTYVDPHPSTTKPSGSGVVSTSASGESITKHVPWQNVSSTKIILQQPSPTTSPVLQSAPTIPGSAYINTGLPGMISIQQSPLPSADNEPSAIKFTASQPASGSGGYVNSNPSYVNTLTPSSDSSSPSFSGSALAAKGYVPDSGPASCPINPAYAPSRPSVDRPPASAPALVKSISALTEQEKLTIEEAKAKMKFREIKFEELQILKKLGVGTLGTVYLAMWRGSLVAAKKLEEQHMDDEMINLFKQEAATMHVLSHHPSLASFVGAVCVPPNVCIVSHYYRYGSLEAALRGPKRLELTWKQVVKIAMDAAAGIHHLHKEGVLHRRISSRNILLGDGLRAYVNDFAFSHIKPRDTVYTHTAGTSFIGPVRYMSPDAMMHKYSEGSDAWAFGVLLWELWERKEPFEGDDDMTVAFRVSQDNQTLPISSSCPLVLASVMKQCWLDRPSQRPSFIAMHETLESYYKQLP